MATEASAAAMATINKCKKMSLQLIRIQIPVKYHKIDIHRIQYQFNRHQHGNQVPAGKKTINAYKKHQGAYNQKMCYGNPAIIYV